MKNLLSNTAKRLKVSWSKFRSLPIWKKTGVFFKRARKTVAVFLKRLRKTVAVFLKRLRKTVAVFLKRLRKTIAVFLKHISEMPVKHKLIFACSTFIIVAGIIVISFIVSRHASETEQFIVITPPRAADNAGADAANLSPYIDSNGQILLPKPEAVQHQDEREALLKNESLILVEYGTRHELIPEVQERLMELWYMDQDEPTDYLGKYTSAALKSFQRTSGLNVTGELNAATYYTLMSPDAKTYLCSLGDSGADVNELQDRLYELGYLEGRTGLFDEKTEEAVKQFQTANALTADGQVGKTTKEKMYDPNAKPNVLSLSSEGDMVLKCQQRLKQLGYLTTEPDGVYGRDTEMAVRRFQEQNSLMADGYLGPTTRHTLLDKNAKGNALSYAMSGSDIMRVQKRLYELNYIKAKHITGNFKSVTEEAVTLFQKNNGLHADGTVGRNTMKKLFSENPVKAKKPVTGKGSSVTSSRIERFIKIAAGRLGCPYIRGAKGPNKFDCSGLVYWCLNQAGVSQGYLTSLYWRNYDRYQRNTNIYKIRRGDVIVYRGHVAIALGNWMMIDASQSKGKVVQRGFNSRWFRRNFICSYHIFGG